MGLSGSKQRTSSTSTGTATTTPQIPSWIQGPASQYFGQIGTLLNNGSGGTPRPASPLQTQAFSSAAGLGLNQVLAEAINGSRGLLNFTPDNVTAGQLSETDLSPYMNPYTRDVIDNSVRDLERARAGIVSGTQGVATRAGAYGGSRHGIADAETNRGFLDGVSSLVAGLRDSNFRNAQSSAMFDIGNRLSTDTANADRGVTGAGIRLNAAGQMGSQAVAQDANTRANIGTQATLGERERDIATENDPEQQRIAWLSQIAQLLGINPAMFAGQTVNSSGSQTGTSSQSGGLLGGFGSLLSGIGSIWGPGG